MPNRAAQPRLRSCRNFCQRAAAGLAAVTAFLAWAAPVQALDPVAAQAQGKAAVQRILGTPQKRRLGASLDPNTSQQQSSNAYVSGLVGRPVTVQQLSATLLAGTAPIYSTLSGMGSWATGAYRANDTALILGAVPATIATSGSGADLTAPVPATLLPTISALLDQMGTAQGSLLYRGASGWALLPPGASGYLLASGGQASNPSFVSPASVGGTVSYVPTRVLSSTGAVAAQVSDYLIVLNGPSELDLEHAPPIGTTHAVKQVGSAQLSLVATGGDQIEGATSFPMPLGAAKPAISVSYTSLGWVAY